MLCKMRRIASMKIHPSEETRHFCGANFRRGSALLLTLLVSSLLMIVVLAFSVFVRMSLRDVVRHQQEREARAAARLGMNMALGQLQHVAGPDQRVTARGDLLNGTSTRHPGSTVHPEHAHWTGVWDSSVQDETDPTVTSFLGWLVSMADSASTNTLAVAGTASASARVKLLGEGTTSAQGHVEVEKVSLLPGQAYAWWVGDEGVKARFGSLDPYRTSLDDAERMYATAGGQRLAMEVVRVDGTERLGDQAYPTDHPDFQRTVSNVFSGPQLELVGEDYADLRANRYHDLSLHSAGVLTNVKEGGLRKDLSLAFEMPYEDWVASEFVEGHPYAEVPLYQPAGYPAGRMVSPLYRMDTFPFDVEPGPVPNLDPPVPFVFDPISEAAHKTSLVRTSTPVLRGPNWDLFRNFYRMYKANDPDLAEYGLPPDANLDAQGRIAGRAPFPSLYGLAWSRRYGQESLTWDYAELNGPSGEDYTMSIPMGRPVLPGVAPVVTRIQTVMSFGLREVGDLAGVPQYELDMYLDPVVTLWNPYNVPLKTGRDYGQPLVLTIRFINLEANVEVTPPGGVRTAMRQAFGDYRNPDSANGLLAHYSEDDSRFNPSQDELLQMELVLGNRVLEPGEVLVFSHAGPAKPYWRDEAIDTNSDGYLVAGPDARLELRPGVDQLTGDSGSVLRNVIPALRNSSVFPGGRIPHDSQIRFRLDPGHTVSQGLKYRVEALKQGAIEPFMSSFQAGVADMGSSWSPLYLPDELTGGKQLVAFYDSYLKHASSPDPVNLLSVFNPRAQSFEQGTTFRMEASAYQPDATRDLVEDLWWGEGRNADSLQGLIEMSGDNGFWGPDNRSIGFTDWNTHIPLFEVPVRPMTSLGQFRHLQLSWMADEPAYVFGNSRFSPFVGFSNISQQPLNHGNVLETNRRHSTGREPLRNEWAMTRSDTAWLVNDVLWDGYYFSGIAPGNGFPTPGARWADHLGTQSPLPNSQYRSHVSPDSRDGAEWFDSSGDPLPGSPAAISGHLLVDGMLNINSTSVNAWRALLAGTRKVSVQQADGSWTAASGSAMGRLMFPHDGENQAWTGFRGLTDDQIDLLAESIVQEVKARGPFLSMSDFVNRRLSEEPDPADVHPHMRAGALQAAIDASGINTLFSETLTDAGLSPARSELSSWVRNRIEGNRLVEEGANGDLTQADVLSAIAPLLSARSDTFIIRSYGEIGDGNTARAWCEAVVQRVPDYLQSSRTPSQVPDWQPHEIPEDIGTYDTTTPRRRFRILSFRWLNPEDV